MVLINIYFVFMYITVLLQKIVSAPPKKPDRPLTSSIPYSLDEPIYSSNYYYFLEGNYIFQPRYKTNMF